MRKYIIAGNWKMNLTLEEGYGLATEIKGMISDEVTIEKAEVVLIPSFIHLSGIKQLLKGTSIKLGAQNCYYKNKGAFTGEISPAMLANLGIQYVIIGHSERRLYNGETNDLLAKKINAALENGLTPIYCFGETLTQRENGLEFSINESQVREGLFHLTETQIKKVVLAYEPVWAIGTGKTATSTQAQQIHAFIRNELAKKYGYDAADKISILYGGSMKPENAKELLGCKDIDGGLIGGAALESRSFVEIVKLI